MQEEKQIPILTCLLITWNRRDVLKRNLLTLLKNISAPSEIIVVDNASADGTWEMLQQEFPPSVYPRCRFFRMDKNCGIAAYNRGAKEARGEYIFILDDDSFPASGVDKKIIRHFAAEPDTGIIACNIKNDKTEEKYKSWHLPVTAEEDNWINFIGCGAVIRKELFCRAGFYPARFFLYENELDVSLKVLAFGYRIAYNEEYVVFHDYSSAKRGTDMQIYHGTKNKLLLLWKFFPYPLAIRLSFSFLLSNLLLCVKKGKVMLRLKAWGRAFYLLPGYLQEGGAERGRTMQHAKELEPFLREFSVATWVERLRKEEDASSQPGGE